MASEKPLASKILEMEDDQENRISALIYQSRVLPSSERVVVLLDVSSEIEGSNFDDASRIELLELCMIPASQTLVELSNDYITKTLPLSDEIEATAIDAIEIAESIDRQFAAIEPDQRGIDYKLVLHRRLQLLLELLTFMGASYIPWAPTLWNRIHRIYIDAQNHRATSYRGKPLVENRKQPTIENLYVTALLTAVSDPYQLPYRDIQRARKIARAFANDVKVIYFNTNTESSDAPHRLLIDDRVDRPTLPYRPGKVLDYHNVVLDLDDCCRILSQRLDTLRNKKKNKDPLFPDESYAEVISIYRHVLSKWSMPPTRYTTRNSANIEFDLLLNQFGILEEFCAPKHIEPRLDIDATQCLAGTSVNISDTGIGLRIAATSNVIVRVGELIALREHGNQSNDWRLSVVRWIHNIGSGIIEVGVLTIPGRLYVPLLHGLKEIDEALAGDAKQQSMYLSPVLLTGSDESDDAMTAQLVIRRKLPDSNYSQWLTFAGSDRLIKSMKLFLRTRYLTVYTCQLSEPRQKPHAAIPSEIETDFRFPF